jgi:hypothetical protein
MAEIETNQEELRKMLKELLNLDPGLNEYELKFIENLNGWIGDFTPKQAKKLQDIWYRHF